MSREQKRGNTNIEAIKYFYEKWKTNNSKYSTILEAEDESRVCQTCHQIWIGSSLEADCEQCNKPTIDTGPIGKWEKFLVDALDIMYVIFISSIHYLKMRDEDLWEAKPRKSSVKWGLLCGPPAQGQIWWALHGCLHI